MYAGYPLQILSDLVMFKLCNIKAIRPNLSLLIQMQYLKGFLIIFQICVSLRL